MDVGLAYVSVPLDFKPQPQFALGRDQAVRGGAALARGDAAGFVKQFLEQVTFGASF